MRTLETSLRPLRLGDVLVVVKAVTACPHEDFGHCWIVNLNRDAKMLIKNFEVVVLAECVVRKDRSLDLGFGYFWD